MPHRAKISDTYGISVELEDDDATASDLGDKALELLAKATAIADQRPPGATNSAWLDRRGTPTHTDPNYSSNIGFAPVKAGIELGDTKP